MTSPPSPGMVTNSNLFKIKDYIRKSSRFMSIVLNSDSLICLEGKLKISVNKCTPNKITLVTKPDTHFCALFNKAGQEKRSVTIEIGPFIFCNAGRCEVSGKHFGAEV